MQMVEKDTKSKVSWPRAKQSTLSYLWARKVVKGVCVCVCVKLLGVCVCVCVESC